MGGPANRRHFTVRFWPKADIESTSCRLVRIQAKLSIINNLSKAGRALTDCLLVLIFWLVQLCSIYVVRPASSILTAGPSLCCGRPT